MGIGILVFIDNHSVLILTINGSRDYLFLCQAFSPLLPPSTNYPGLSAWAELYQPFGPQNAFTRKAEDYPQPPKGALVSMEFPLAPISKSVCCEAEEYTKHTMKCDIHNETTQSVYSNRLPQVQPP